MDIGHGEEVILHSSKEMTPTRPLHSFSRQEYAILQTWGFLKDFYPSATGDYTKDSAAPEVGDLYKQVQLPRRQSIGQTVGYSMGGYAQVSVEL